MDLTGLIVLLALTAVVVFIGLLNAGATPVPAGAHGHGDDAHGDADHADAAHGDAGHGHSDHGHGHHHDSAQTGH